MFDTAIMRGLQFFEGFIVELTQDKGIVVDAENLAQPLFCSFLKTTISPPQFTVGDKVLFTIINNEENRGCVLGVIEQHLFEQKHDKVTFSDKESISSEEFLEISAPKGIVIKCGKGSIKLTKDGRIYLDGTHISSRSRGTNKVKGASVRIN